MRPPTPAHASAAQCIQSSTSMVKFGTIVPEVLAGISALTLTFIPKCLMVHFLALTTAYPAFSAASLAAPIANACNANPITPSSPQLTVNHAPISITPAVYVVIPFSATNVLLDIALTSAHVRLFIF